MAGQVVIKNVRPEADDGLIFGTLALGPVLQPDHPPAGDDAALAGAGAGQDGIGHGGAGDLVDIFEGALVIVFLRHGAEIVGKIGRARRCPGHGPPG